MRKKTNKTKQNRTATGRVQSNSNNEKSTNLEGSFKEYKDKEREEYKVIITRKQT